MRRMIIHGGILGAVVVLAVQAWPYPEFSRQTRAACAACHVSPAGGAELSASGKAFKTDRKKAPDTTLAVAAYIGNDKCQICHAKQYKSWQTTKHAHALEMLKAAPDSAIALMASRLKVKLKGPPAESDACVVCHVTGYRLAGGYPAADSARTAAVANVGCESCHGPGGAHFTAAPAEKKQTIVGKVSAGTCVQCHTPVMSPKFNYEEARRRGTHILRPTG